PRTLPSGSGFGPGGRRSGRALTMESCCGVKAATAASPMHCPDCGKPGRLVDRITVKAMLRPEALMRLSAPEHRFCATPECPVVYFGIEEAFELEESVVPVFQKEPAGDRPLRCRVWHGDGCLCVV